MTTLGCAAVVYAERGWHVFPLIPRRKVPLTRHGLHDASRDPELVAAWWGDHPQANVGLSCGPSGILVIDLDGDAGRRSWADLAAGVECPRTLTAQTAHGFHLYFRGEGRSSAGKLGPGIDTRGKGGYVVAPPSVHESGIRYGWIDPRAPIATAPPSIVTALALPPRSPSTGERRELPFGVPHTPYGRAALEGLCDDVLGAAEGRRNDTLNRVAFRIGRLIAAGELDATVAEQAIVEAALAVGLSQTEAIRTYCSGVTAGDDAGPAARRTA